MEVQLTPRVREAFARLESIGVDETEWPAGAVHAYAHGKVPTIPVSDVQRLSSSLRQHVSFAAAAQPTWVHQLLEGAAPVLPLFAPERKRDKALERRLEQLRAVQQNREYAAMVGNLSSGESSGRDEAEMTTYRSQMGVGLNLLVSMATMFCVGYYAAGTKEEPHGVRATIGGLILCILTMGVEMALFMIGATRVDAKMHKRAEEVRRKGVHDLTRMREHYPDEVSTRRAR